MEPFEIGRIIDKRYRILRELKGGSMATVYVAEDLQKAQTVAIKVLREELASQPEFIRRFSREAQKLKRLAHNDIVRIWDFHRKGSLAYIVMEYIEGGTLLKRIADLESKPMSAEKILRIMTPVCNALTMAHRAGIVHCDIKPANIMIRPGGRSVITDFGIAREVEGTATMEHFGTSAYMSPEQIRGASPTPAMDIYALGVILFQLVTGGQRPFNGKGANITGTTGEKIRWEQTHLLAPSPRKYNKGVSREFEALILKCLDKDPLARFKSVQELLHMLKSAPIFSEHVESLKPLANNPVKTDVTTHKIFYRTVKVPVAVWIGALILVSAGFFVSFGSPIPLYFAEATQTIRPTTTHTATATRTATTVPSPTFTPLVTPIPIALKLYNEDFEGGEISDWTTYVGTWSINEESSNNYWVGTGSEDYPQAWIDETYDWTDYAFESKIRIIRGGVFICLRADQGSSFYNVFVNSNGGGVTIAQYLKGNYQTFEETTYALRRNRWYTMRFEAEGNRLRFYIDEKLVLSSTRDAISSGAIGFYMGGGDEIHFDDIRVWSLE